MRKRKLKDWMGENWAVEEVESDDPRLGENSNALLDYKKHHILYAPGDQTVVITRLVHEAMHRATGWGSENDYEELLTEHATISILQFLRKMGVDLSPLVDS